MITTAHAHKSGVIFHFFPRAFKQKKNKALRPKMTKIASKGGGGGGSWACSQPEPNHCDCSSFSCSNTIYRISGFLPTLDESWAQTCSPSPIGHSVQGFSTTYPASNLDDPDEYTVIDTSLKITPPCVFRVSSVSFYRQGKCKITFGAWRKKSANVYTLAFVTDEFSIGNKNDDLRQTMQIVDPTETKQIFTGTEELYLGYMVDNGGPDKACHISVNTSSTSVELRLAIGKPNDKVNEDTTTTMTLTAAPAISFQLQGRNSLKKVQFKLCTRGSFLSLEIWLFTSLLVTELFFLWI